MRCMEKEFPPQLFVYVMSSIGKWIPMNRTIFKDIVSHGMKKDLNWSNQFKFRRHIIKESKKCEYIIKHTLK